MCHPPSITCLKWFIPYSSVPASCCGVCRTPSILPSTLRALMWRDQRSCCCTPHTLYLTRILCDKQRGACSIGLVNIFNSNMTGWSYPQAISSEPWPRCSVVWHPTGRDWEECRPYTTRVLEHHSRCQTYRTIDPLFAFIFVDQAWPTPFARCLCINPNAAVSCMLWWSRIWAIIG